MISAPTLHNSIEERILSLSEHVVQGGCATIETYREKVGQIQSFREVLEMMREKSSEGPASSHK